MSTTNFIDGQTVIKASWLNDVNALVYGGSGVGTVTSVSVASANGFTGSVATPTSTPVITLTTSLTGLLKGNGTALQAAASGTDFSAGTAALSTGLLKSTTGTGTLSTAVAGTDFAPATSGAAILYGNSAGGFSPVTIGANLTFTAGTLAGSSSSQVYPGAGIPNSTGTAWGTSYTTTGSGTVVALATSPTFVTPILGTPTSGTATNLTGLPLTTGVTGTLPVGNGGTGVTTSTGSGANVLATSPTLVTPILGTPTSGVATNLTGLPLTTGVTGTLPVANGGTGVTTSTGSGANVLGTSPTLVTPAITTSVAVAGTANTITVAGSTTTNPITLTATGTDTNIGVNIVTKGTGAFTINGSAVGSGDVTTTGVQTLTNKTISGTSNTITVDGTNSVGFLVIPQNSQSAAYTTVLADAGKHILHPSADTTARIFTISANVSVAYVVGTAITFINQNAAGAVTIAITTDTMRLAGAGTTGSRTLAANGVATAIKITTTEWIISGTGLT